MKRIFYMLLLVSAAASAQKKTIDSLNGRLKGKLSDSARIELSLKLAKVYRDTLPDKGMQLMYQTAALASKTNHKDLLIDACIQIAEAFEDQAIADSLHKYTKKAIDLATTLKDNESLGRAHNLNGNSYLQARKFDLAQKEYLAALTFYESTKNPLPKGNLMVNFGYLFQQMGNVEKAHEYYDGALKIFKEINNQKAIAQVYNNLGILYGENNQLKKSEAYFNESTKIREHLNNNSQLAYSYLNLGGINVLLKNYEKGRLYNDKALKLFVLLKNNQGIASCYTNSGQIEQETGNYKKSVEAYNQALLLATKIKDMENMENALVSISNTYEKMGDFKTAYRYDNELIKLKDTIYNKGMSKQIAELETKYKTEKKTQEIALLNKQGTIQKLQIKNRNVTIGVVAGALLITVCFGFLFYNRYRLKQAAILQAEVIKQQDIASKSIIDAEERERRRIASDLHDGVGQLFSAVKMNLGSLFEHVEIKEPAYSQLAEKTMLMVDESCREVRSIAHQMMPNALLKAGLGSAVKDFINKIDSHKLKITVETTGLGDRLDNNTEAVLYRVIQECVNNVIKHAGATRLDIQLTREDNEVSVTIEDNGKGFDSTQKEKFEGIGLKNIITRITYLKGTVDISSAPGKGTLVAIYVPLTLS
ncbi:MAG: sensor histidine kinase [Mucilaginibacter sp.]